MSEKLNTIGKVAHLVAYAIMVWCVTKAALFVFVGSLLGYMNALYILEESGHLTPELSQTISYAMDWNAFYMFMAGVSIVAYIFLRKKVSQCQNN